jgi:hypothetical protein
MAGWHGVAGCLLTVIWCSRTFNPSGECCGVQGIRKMPHATPPSSQTTGS